MKLINRLFCKHNYKFVRNIYGDEINHLNGKRSVWVCEKCGKLEYRDYLEPVGTLFAKMLNRKYDEYYKNKFNDWKKENETTINLIKNEMIQAAEQGKCLLNIKLIIDEKHNDRYYWEQLFGELGITYDRDELPDKEVQIYPIDYHLIWKN